jgi:heat shock protein HslJ
MKAPVVKTPLLLLCAMAAAGILTTGCMTSSESVKPVSTQTLLGTHWRLTQLGNEVIDNPAGERAVNFVLQSSSTSLAGFSGCNRMFGRYALEGPSLKFDGLGGTRMFCEAQMPLEQRFLAMFSQVSGWEISGTTLRLLDASGKTVAAFNSP